MMHVKIKRPKYTPNASKRFLSSCVLVVLVGAAAGEGEAVELRILGCPRPSIEVLQSRLDGAVAHSANVDGGVATERIDVVGRSGEHVVLLPGSAGAMRSVQGTLSNAFIQMIGDAYEDSVNEPMPDELLDELKGMAAQSSLATGSLIERVVRDDAYVFTVGAARVKTGGVEVDVLSTGYWAVLNESCVARGVFFVQPPMQPDAIVQEMSSILDELSS